MNVLIKSKFYHAEILRWILLGSLIAWAITTTILALRNTKETVVIGISSSGSARLVTVNDEKILQDELKEFLRSFLEGYYTYDDLTFEERMGKATDLMTKDLWEREKPKILGLAEKLKTNPLNQYARIKNIDLLEEGRIEAILEVRTKQRLAEAVSILKVSLKFERHERSKENPWSYQVTEVSDVVL